MIGETDEQKDGQSMNQSKSKRSREDEVFLSSLAKHVNKHNPDNPGMGAQERGDNLGRIAGFGVGIGSMYLQEILGYPFIVLRRQCQVNHGSLKYHILPVTLFRVIGRIHHRQGAGVFWKGWGSTCIVKGVTIMTEVAICELLHIPRESEDKLLVGGSNVKTVFTHELLKGLSLLMTLPLYSASLVDSVQTAALGQSRSVLTFFKDAADRMVGWYVSRGHGRLLPIYSLIIPSIIYGVLRYSTKSFIAYFLFRINSKRYDIDKKSNERNMKVMYYTELMSNLISSLLTDIIMYPMETVMVRIHLQGTRTIIDDTDKGIGVVPLCTNYDGMTDCIKSIYHEEGFSGFYKGFGTLILQYLIQTIIVKAAKPLYCASV